MYSDDLYDLMDKYGFEMQVLNQGDRKVYKLMQMVSEFDSEEEAIGWIMMEFDEI